MKVLRLVVGQLQSNCYLVIDQETLEGVIIDPGDDAEYIMNKIQEEGMKPQRIIATHGHFDHIMAAYELQLAYNIPFSIHKSDSFLVERMNQTAVYFIKEEVGPPPKIDSYLKNNSMINFASHQLEVIGAPGHTPGGVCFYSKKDQIFFVGDLLFLGGGAGRTDFSYSDEKSLRQSLAKIFKYPPETTIYPGHGNQTTIKEERRYHF